VSFGDGDLHERVRTLEGYNASLEDKIDHLKDVNGKLCAEINRQERVIEELREKEAAYMDANHEQGMQLIEQGKRIAELERMLEHDRLEIICYENDVDARDALIRDMYCQLLNAYDAKELDEFGKRMRELGIEASE